MKTIQIEIPDESKKGYRKFSIYRREVVNGEPHYWLKDENGYPYPLCVESYIEPYTEPKDITDHIKTFDDACKWCKDNDKQGLYEQYADALNVGLQRAKDILAYLKLRIITCALNEGWVPTFDDGEERWYACYDIADNITISDNTCFTTFPEINFDSACRLSFKSSELAEYAATQFKDIYMDFCYKGKE